MAAAMGFRPSTYITLAIACITQGYAQYPLFPSVSVFSALVVVSLMVIYQLETRVTLLSIPAANRVGGTIAFVCAIWIGYQAIRESQTHAFGMLGWPMFVVVLLSPMLMAAIPAKLLRTEKHAGDYWQLHVAALGEIGLSCAMSETPVTFTLTTIYAFFATWSLAAFFRVRMGRYLPPADVNESKITWMEINTLEKSESLDGKWVVIWFIAAAAAIPLYLITPRSQAGKFDFARQRIEIGYAADQMVDLNRTGDLESNSELAFQVVAENKNGTPKMDLDPEQLWRGSTLIRYQGGVWQREVEVNRPAIKLPAHRTGSWSPPDMGPEQYSLTFTVPTKLRSYFLADPVAWQPDSYASVADIVPNSPLKPWYTLPDGSFVRLPSSARTVGQSIRYVQYQRPSPEPGLSQAFRLDSEIQRLLIMNPLSRVKKLADEVVAKAVDTGHLDRKVLELDPVSLLRREEHHEAIARELNRYLIENYGYTTNVKRGSIEVDPIEDFLFQTKSGHCERFATSLILMARSQGIPSLLILGFKGAQSLGNGQYEVLQESAHAWAEVLISRQDPHAPPERLFSRKSNREWHWLSLDPSPLREEANTNSSKNVESGSASAWIKRTFNQFVLKYTPEQRERSLRRVGEFLVSREFLASLPIALLFVLAFWRLRLWRRAGLDPHDSGNIWIKPLVKVLERYGFRRENGQTFGEFAKQVEIELHNNPTTLCFATTPSDWVECYYQSRFGGVEIDDERELELRNKLDRLEQSLEALSRSKK